MENHNAEWDFFFTQLNDKPYSISLDLALADWAQKAAYPYLVRAFIYLRQPDDNGFPTSEESESLFEMEDAIAEKTAAYAILAGKVKGEGKLVLFLYASQQEGLEVLIESAIQSDYEYAVQIDEDATWDGYANFLYPDEYDFKAIMNRRVLTQLQEQGDALEAAREVDHWAYFKTEAGAKAFSKSIAAEGFETQPTQAAENEDGYTVALNFSREEEPDLAHLNNVTWYLMDQADEHDGRYDGWGCPVIK